MAELEDFRMVLPELVDTVFRAAPSATEWLDDALGRIGDYELEDLMPDLHEGRMQLWIGYRGSHVDVAVLTQIQQRPRQKVGLIFALGGENRAMWLHRLSDIEDWFRSEGCARVDAFPRPGLAREMTEYRKSHLWLMKAL